MVAQWVLVGAILTNGLLAGLFFAFACSVVPAFARLDDGAYVAAFRLINAAIINPWFLPVFFLAPALALVAVGAQAAEGDLGAAGMLGAAASAATFLVTVAANVPLNRRLDAAPTASGGERRVARDAFEGPWRRWNLVRTVTGAVAVLALAAAA